MGKNSIDFLVETSDNQPESPEDLIYPDASISSTKNKSKFLLEFIFSSRRQRHSNISLHQVHQNKLVRSPKDSYTQNLIFESGKHGKRQTYPATLSDEIMSTDYKNTCDHQRWESRQSASPTKLKGKHLIGSTNFKSRKLELISPKDPQFSEDINTVILNCSASYGPLRLNKNESSNETIDCTSTKSYTEHSDLYEPSFPLLQSLTVDIRAICNPSNKMKSRNYIHYLIRRHIFDICSTKWAAYYLNVIKSARQRKVLKLSHAISLRWVILCLVQHEIDLRTQHQERNARQLSRKMTDFRVAMQCLTDITVLKFGRKGRPHFTQLCIENGDTIRWTSKFLANAANSMHIHRERKNRIALSAIKTVRCGPTTDVLIRAVQKGMLSLQDAKCTLSVITSDRTFDVKFQSVTHRDWFRRSLLFLVDLVKDREIQMQKQVEFLIIKRIQCTSVLKHGRKGKPHKTRLYINKFGELSWTGRSGQYIQLGDIEYICKGKETAVFRRSSAASYIKKKNTNTQLCFSLVTKRRTLDIEVESEQLRDWFVVAFEYLREKVHEKKATIRRERIEKQLRNLNDLSHELIPLSD